MKPLVIQPTEMTRLEFAPRLLHVTLTSAQCWIEPPGTLGVSAISFLVCAMCIYGCMTGFGKTLS